jgi:phthiocerol/phenolphthiocerol synthesis type-I polyketide synthase E
MNKKDIAIVGMSCKFSYSDSLDEYWMNLKAGKEMLYFFSQEELSVKNVKKELINDPEFIKVKSHIRNKSSFDYGFFGYTRSEAEYMDPQIRLFHEYTWKALEDAGYDPFSYVGKIGLFAGASEHGNWMAYNTLKGKNPDIDPHIRNALLNRSFISTMVSYKLNLRGPSVFVDTACSTSLVAIHLGCRNLLMRECDLAVAGAVRIETDGTVGYKYREGMIFSKDGHCRVFDADSSGTISGEGVGVIVMKRIEDAVRDNDHVYAIIKSTAVNNDGNRKVGYTAPSASGQYECIRMALKTAGIEPQSISYIEAHGTGTRLGDPVEVEALNRAFGKTKEKYCAIGSVKSNLGHLDTAAGIAGIIKTVLSLVNREIPPSLHYYRPNPEIEFGEGPFYVNASLAPWISEEERPRRAGVSSFGIGGTNAHVILEEAPVTEAAHETEPTSCLLLITSKKATGLKQQAAELRTFIEARTEQYLPDIAYTLQCKRRHFNYRRYVVCRNREEAIVELSKEFEGVRSTAVAPEIVFMFSGQGSQYVNMGLGIYKANDFFKKEVDKGLEILENLNGADWRAVLFNENASLDRSDLDNTLYAQPLLFLIEYALAQLLIHLGIMPGYLIGHSIGELTAAAVSGVFSFEEGLAMTVERARLMASMPAGEMLAVSLPENGLLPFLETGLSIAAFNDAQSCVVSGSRGSIKRIEDKLAAGGVSYRKLITSHAFHSAMMDPILEEFEAKAAQIEMQSPKISMLSNISGGFFGIDEINAAYWSRQIRQPVRFYSGISEIVKTDGKKIFLELGPGSTLTTFCKRINKDNNTENIALNLLRHPLDKTSDMSLFNHQLGELWLNSVTVDWQALNGGSGGKAMLLPGYCFERNDLPCEADVSSILAGDDFKRGWLSPGRDLSEWFYLPSWERSIYRNSSGPRQNPGTCLLFSDQGAVATKLKEQLTAEGYKVVEVIKFDQLADVSCFEPALVIYTWGLSEEIDPDGTADSGRICDDFLHLLDLCKWIVSTDAAVSKRFFFITNEMQEIFAAERNSATANPAAFGILKVLAQENPNIFCCNIDISRSEGIREVVGNIWQEVLYNSKDQVVAFRKGNRWVGALEQALVDGEKCGGHIRQGGCYVITGGLGRLGTCIAEHLITTYHANVVLLGRAKLPPEGMWPEIIAGQDSDRVLVNKIRALIRLKGLHGTVDYWSVDVADESQLDQFVSYRESHSGQIDGIIHAAGNMSPANFRPIDLLNKVNVADQFAPKVSGVINLYKVFRDKKVDFVWIASSLSNVVGGLAFGSYVASNTFVDHFVASRRDQLRNWVCVDLDGLMSDEDPDDDLISSAELVEIFERSFQLMGHPVIIVSKGDMEMRVRDYALKYRKGTASIPKKEVRSFSELPVRAVNGFDIASGTEENILEVWQEYFGVDVIGLHDSFFDLGGDSLKAMTLAKRLFQKFGIDLPVKVFFSNPSISDLAREVDIALDLKRANGVGAGGDSKAIII